MFSTKKFTRCFYEMAREYIEQPCSSKLRMLHALDCALFVYSFRTVAMAYNMYQNYTVYNCQLYDPMCNYLHERSHFYDPFVPLIVLLFEAFNFACLNALYRANVRSITWQWWHQLVVQNQDAYFDSLVTDPTKLKKIYAKKEAAMLARISSFRIISLFPARVKRAISTVLARVDAFIRLENVQQRKLFQKPLSIMPKLSRKIRSLVLITLLVSDKLCLLAQCVIGEFV